MFPVDVNPMTATVSSSPLYRLTRSQIIKAYIIFPPEFQGIDSIEFYHKVNEVILG